MHCFSLWRLRRCDARVQRHELVAAMRLALERARAHHRGMTGAVRGQHIAACRQCLALALEQIEKGVVVAMASHFKSESFDLLRPGSTPLKVTENGSDRTG